MKRLCQKWVRIAASPPLEVVKPMGNASVPSCSDIPADTKKATAVAVALMQEMGGVPPISGNTHIPARGHEGTPRRGRIPSQRLRCGFGKRKTPW